MFANQLPVYYTVFVQLTSYNTIAAGLIITENILSFGQLIPLLRSDTNFII